MRFFIFVFACVTQVAGASSFEGTWHATSVSCFGEEGFTLQTVPAQNTDVLDRIQFQFKATPNSVTFQVPFGGGVKGKPGSAVCTQVYYGTYAYSLEKRTFTLKASSTEVKDCNLYSEHFEHGKKDTDISFEAVGGIDVKNNRILYIENILHIQHLLGLDHLDHGDDDCGMFLVLVK